MNVQQLSEKVPHKYRQLILLEWLPVAQPTMENEAMRRLWDAWFVFIEPDGVQNSNCPRCIAGVLNNWLQLTQALTEAEQAYNALQKL